ncbi:MAG: ATP-binding protein [bacterium]
MSIFSRLQVRVTFLFLLMSLVPLVLISILFLRIAQEIITAQVTNQLDNLADDKVSLLERWLGEREADLQVMAESVYLHGLTPGPIDSYVEAIKENYKVYEGIWVVNRAGEALSGQACRPSGCRDELWFQESMAGRGYRSPMMLSQDGRSSVFWLSAPIRDGGGIVIGALRAGVNTGSILSDILLLSLGRTGESYLVDQTGTFLAHQDPERILSENISQSGSFKRIFADSRGRHTYLDYRGILVLGASRQVAGTDWYLVVEQDRDEAFAGLGRLRRYLLLGLAATFSASLLIAGLFASHIVGPIRDLRQAAGELEQGRFENSLVRSDRADEIGDLYRAFRRMATGLKTREDSLEQEVDQKENELRETSLKLEQTEAVAARAQRLAALGQLAAGVAHEIRTPLTSLKLYLQSLGSETEFSREGEEDFRVALKQIQRMEATINRFLNFAKPQEPVLTWLEVPALIEDSLLIVEPRAHHQEIRVKREIAPDLPRLRGDKRQLGEVLLNLMINSLEAMSKGDLLTISASAMEAEGADGVRARRVKIVVADTGQGIAPEAVEKIFDPFFTTKPSGTGLGLSIVHQTVTLHGGEVEVETRSGKGTRFTVILPAAADEACG